MRPYWPQDFNTIVDIGKWIYIGIAPRSAMGWNKSCFCLFLSKKNLSWMGNYHRMRRCEIIVQYFQFTCQLQLQIGTLWEPMWKCKIFVMSRDNFVCNGTGCLYPNQPECDSTGARTWVMRRVWAGKQQDSSWSRCCLRWKPAWALGSLDLACFTEVTLSWA